ncbi:MAG TPA: NUDIX domain-containing protein [Rectinemataceae bacterium]|nr:NUDIX domain-containing protein [Rectinemataceae bacterium]
MNPSILLKSLIPGLLPLVIFVGAQAVFGETVGLAVGVAVGVGEFLFTLIRDRKADPFVAADTLLLALAGGLSLVLHDEIFFKLKPAVIEFVLGAAMGLLLVLPPDYLKLYIGRQLRGIQIQDEAIPAMRKSLGLMLVALGIHIGLTVWAALALSTALWGFISGGLLYILFALFAGIPFTLQLLARRRSGRASASGRASGRRPGLRPGEEMLPLVDENGTVLGSAPRSECHRGPGKLHPVVHLQIADGSGSIYLQKRSASKLVQPGAWDSAVGGHVGMGEDLNTALMRELREELGVLQPALEAQDAKIEPLFRYRWDTDIESELVFSFVVRYRGPFAPDPAEVQEGRFWSIPEIRARLGTGVFTPNFEHEFGIIDRAHAEAARDEAARDEVAKAEATTKTGVRK